MRGQSNPRVVRENIPEQPVRSGELARRAAACLGAALCLVALTAPPAAVLAQTPAGDATPPDKNVAPPAEEQQAPVEVAREVSVPAPSPADDQDFQARCGQPGVVRCYGFDDEADLAPRMFDPSGGPGNCTGDQCWARDTQYKASGAGSLRLEIPSNSGADTSGSFFMNFKDDTSLQFGEGDTFYVQFRQRFTQEMLRSFPGSDGWKQVIVGQGDTQTGCGQDWWDSQVCATSCSQLELVLQSNNKYIGPWFYHSCGNWETMDFYDGTQVRMQHQGPPYCYYPNDPDGGCLRYSPNEWMTFKFRIEIGTWNTNTSRLQIWVKKEADPSVMIYDSNISDPGGFKLINYSSGKYGKVWLLPYNTNKDPGETHPIAYIWYDELIISTADIPDPGNATPTEPPPAPQNLEVD